MTCQACPLHTTRRSIVYGRGPCEDVDVVVVGEAPGQVDDALGEAFTGEIGRLLDFMIQRAGLGAFRIFYTNVVLCHPTDRKGGKTREPAPAEIAACGENVGTILDLANARAVIFAGDIPAKYYARRFPGSFRISHPAFLLRTGGEKSPHYLRNLRTLEEVRAKITG